MEKSVVYVTPIGINYRLEIYSDYDDSYQGEYLVSELEFCAYRNKEQYILKFRKTY